MNNIILFNHPTIGFITLDDIINDLNIIINDLTDFENITLTILKEISEFLDEDISTLFSLSQLERLKWVLYVLKSVNEKK